MHVHLQPSMNLNRVTTCNRKAPAVYPLVQVLIVDEVEFQLKTAQANE